MNITLNIADPEFKVGDKVLFSFRGFGVGFVENREIELYYNPEEEFESGAWSYLVMVNDREGYTVPSNRIFSYDAIESEIKERGIDNVSIKYALNIRYLSKIFNIKLSENRG